jgi:hypothetical protein
MRRLCGWLGVGGVRRGKMFRMEMRILSGMWELSVKYIT